MKMLDPIRLFKRISEDVPADLHKHLFVTGSLAAAYHFAAALESHAINTKDADVVIHPAGDATSAKAIAERLLAIGWRRIDKCFAQSTPEPAENLRAIRLNPPESSDYFLEFLSVPDQQQNRVKCWVPVQLSDGWYGLPSFKYMALTAQHRHESEMGIEYAAPAMMALSNLLMHPTVGHERMESDGPFQGLLRSAKDLGRVIALAYLAGRAETETWRELWLSGLQSLYPEDWRDLAIRAGNGLRELIQDDVALNEAWETTDKGLLGGRSVEADGLRGIVQRLFVDLIDPVARIASE